VVAGNDTQPLANARSVLSLQPEDAAKGRSVQLRAQVVYADPAVGFWCLHDDTAGVGLVRSPDAVPLPTGSIVEVTGISGMRLSQVVVVEQSVRVLGTAPLPPAPPISVDQMVDVRGDFPWVELEVVVEAVLEDGPNTLHLVLTGARDTRASIPGVDASAPAFQDWVDARLRLRGVWTTETDARGRFEVNRFYVPSTNFVSVLRPRSIEASDLPRQPLRRANRFNARAGESRRIKVEGVVTARASRNIFYIQEGNSGIRVHTRQNPTLQAGDLVEVVGFPALDESTPQIEESLVQVLGRGFQPYPTFVDPGRGDLDGGNVEAILTRLEGETVGTLSVGQDAELVVRSGDRYVTVVASGEETVRALQTFKPLSWIEVTGVCVTDHDTRSQALPVRMILRSPADLRLLQAEPLWTLPRAGMLFTLISVALVYWRVRGWRAQLRVETRYRTIFESTSELVGVHGPESGFVDANPAWRNFTGPLPDGSSLRELILPAERAAFDGWWARVVAGQPCGPHRCAVRMAGGRAGHVELRANRMLGAGNRPLVETIGSDLTDRWQAEQQRREVAAIVEFSDDAIIGKTITGMVTSWNQGAEKIFGYSRDEIIGRSILTIFPPGREAEEQRILATIAQGQVMDHFETERVRKDGRMVQVSVNFSPLKDESGRVIGVSSIARDITARKHAEETQARLAAVVEQSSEAVVLASPQGTIIYINPAFERTTGQSKEQLLGQCVDRLKGGDQDAQVYQRIFEELRRGGVWQGALTRHRDDGTEYELFATVSPVLDPRGVFTGYVAVARDVTRERQLEDQLRQSHKMEAVGMLAGGVAHDFNNILSSIILMAELTGSTPHLPAGVASDLEQIRRDAQRAGELTRQLLLFSRRQTLVPRVLDLNRVLSELVQMLERVVREDVHVRLELSPAPLFASADRGMIEQVVTNLAVNARDAMPAGGELVIRTERREIGAEAAAAIAGAKPGIYVGFRVADTGTGIPPEALPRIFEPFFTTKETGRGTGLGLATVFGIVKQHHGWITARNQPGSGAEFEVFLPATSGPTEDPQADGSTELGSPSPGTETILVVEDEPMVRKSTRLVLERAGYQVLEAGNGPEALGLLRQWRGSVDLLITDMVMPERMSGQELARRMRTEPGPLRVLYISGYSRETAGRELSLGPGEAFLQKPFESLRLLDTVRRLLDGPAGPDL
jgi:PAS domain S-box-containing protein